MKAPGCFEILAVDHASGARCGRLLTAHGPVDTPVFMPVGTQATVKAMTPVELEEVGATIILGNTYHLASRPGIEIIRRAGGLHGFMGWGHPILTDSGGYQVFSLATRRTITPDGVEFNVHFDGARFFLGPREAMSIQRALASDIAMAFDECPPHGCTYDYACQAVGRTLSWAAVCAKQERAPGQLLFGIGQGGAFPELRRSCAHDLVAIGFDGYAVGGVSVGESEPELLDAMANGVAVLPADKPRYLMGVGRMRQIVEAVAHGVDMFDCVMPTRYARNGSAFTAHGRFPVKAAEYKDDSRPLEEGCRCYACRTFSRAYIRHLVNVDEILGARMLTVHNLHRYMAFMAEVRASIAGGWFGDLRARWRAGGPSEEPGQRTT